MENAGSNILAYTRSTPELRLLVEAWQGLDDMHRCIVLAQVARYAEELEHRNSLDATLAAAKILLRRMEKDPVK